MLSSQTIEIVKSTAPVLADHAEILTRHFYKRMFELNPEVLPYFNHAHQHAGRQQRALAVAICAYAANIDRLDVLGPSVELIAQKHASLQIKPEHYPIVGANLLGSIGEVLGLGHNDPIIGAWSEAYAFLAQILTSREAQIYDQQIRSKGGWADFKTFKVFKKEMESEIITSFYLAPSDGSPAPDFQAGQYITLRVPTGDKISTTMRNYSLSDKPGEPWLRISVKREESMSPEDPAGYVSGYLHSAVEVGSAIELAAPCGEFVLDREAEDSKPLVFFCAGVGITPIMSMLKECLRKNPSRDVTFIHAIRNQSVQAFRKCIDELAESHSNLRVYYRYSDKTKDWETVCPRSSSGYVDGAFLETVPLRADSQYYVCGPEVFIQNVIRELRKKNVADNSIYFEFFGPRT